MRGLKHSFASLKRSIIKSHLLQMRGLKHLWGDVRDYKWVSHLLQMRGLKPGTDISRTDTTGRIFYRCVDWNAGPIMGTPTAMVASFTDAWIETTRVFKYCSRPRSRIFYRCVDWNKRDAPPVPEPKSRIFYRCVDWNISFTELTTLQWESHLLQMRGLKQRGDYLSNCLHCRIFYRCVDWNWSLKSDQKSPCVASFTDAWIETAIKGMSIPGNTSHLLQMRGLKQQADSAFNKQYEVASFTDAWIETISTK